VLYLVADDEPDPGTGDRHSLLVLDNHSAGFAPPPGSRWVRASDLGAIELADPVQRALVARWWSGEHASAGTDRPVWQRPGWFAGALAWVIGQLEQRGIRLVGPAEQLGTKVARYLMRVPTSAGWIYFKAVSAMYAPELRLAELLSARYPRNVPRLLAAHPRQRWYATFDHGGTPPTGGAGRARCSSSLSFSGMPPIRSMSGLAPVVRTCDRSACRAC
jgi:hypothetical protein